MLNTTMKTLTLPTKRQRPLPLVWPESRREEYITTIVLRTRRPFSTLTNEERRRVLLAGAEYLERLAQQMRDEALL